MRDTRGASTMKFDPFNANLMRIFLFCPATYILADIIYITNMFRFRNFLYQIDERYFDNIHIYSLAILYYVIFSFFAILCTINYLIYGKFIAYPWRIATEQIYNQAKTQNHKVLYVIKRCFFPTFLGLLVCFLSASFLMNKSTRVDIKFYRDLIGFSLCFPLAGMLAWIAPLSFSKGFIALRRIFSDRNSGEVTK